MRSGDDTRFAASEGRIAGLGRLRLAVVEKRLHRGRRDDAIAPQHGLGVGERRRIGRGRTGGDHRRVVARHVGNDQRHDPGRGGRARQPAALDRRQMLADAVDLIDVGAAPEQRLVQGLLVVERDPRSRQGKQSRASARDQTERQIVGTQAFDEFQNPARRLLARRVGNGMGGLDHLDPLQRADAVAIARDDKAVREACHLANGLRPRGPSRRRPCRRPQRPCVPRAAGEDSRARPCRERPRRSRPRTCPAATAALSWAWRLRPTPSLGRFRGGRVPLAREPCPNGPTPRRLRRPQR